MKELREWRKQTQRPDVALNVEIVEGPEVNDEDVTEAESLNDESEPKGEDVEALIDSILRTELDPSEDLPIAAVSGGDGDVLLLDDLPPTTHSL